MKKAIIVGGNQGGLNMARCLAEAGFSVEVFEKKERGDVAYDWTDEMDPKIFEELGLPLPDESGWFHKKDWTFVNPNESIKLFVKGGAQAGDLSMYRRPLNEYFYNLIKDKENVTVHYGKKVERLVLADDKVVGVTVDGVRIPSDLVVDCGGAHSEIRESLPESFGIPTRPNPGETFVAYRGFFKPKEGVEEPKYTNKAYLQHIGEKGISWCIYGEGMVDILIGRIDKLTKEDIDRGLAALKKDNPILSDELIKCGFCSIIPVRYPISKMVADGYVLCGDSAYMTIPLMGSGMFCSLLCGKMLAEVLQKDDDCGEKNLWNYQLKFYDRFGAYCGVDVLKRWLLSAEAKDIDFLFEKGIFDEKIMGNGVGGDPIKLSFGEILKKAWQGKSRIGLLLKIVGMLGDSDKVNAIAKKIPQEYDREKIAAWQKELDGFFNND
ncbi:MAG: hypothetical protein IJ735_01280 [Clostridia bacterium]|nr:hypothetical protein [Clostridia bacterium]